MHFQHVIYYWKFIFQLEFIYLFIWSLDFTSWFLKASQLELYSCALQEFWFHTISGVDPILPPLGHRKYYDIWWCKKKKKAFGSQSRAPKMYFSPERPQNPLHFYWFAVSVLSDLCNVSTLTVTDGHYMTDIIRFSICIRNTDITLNMTNKWRCVCVWCVQTVTV